MRLKVRSLRQAVKGDLPIEFSPQRLTSYGGLELVRRYFRSLALVARLRTTLAAIPSDYGSARLALLVIGLFYVGARRLEHCSISSAIRWSRGSAAWPVSRPPGR
jgi:hypothetical protein